MIKYEIKKVWGNLRNVKFIVFLMFLLSIITIYQGQHYEVDAGTYKKTHQLWDGKSIADADTYLIAKADEQTFYNEYYLHQDDEAFLTKYQEKYGDDWVSFQLNNVEKNINESFDQAPVYQQLQKEVQGIATYAPYRKSIREQYEERNNISIFKNNSKNQDAIRFKTLQIYEKLSIGSLQLEPELSVQLTLSSTIFDVVCIIMVLYLVFVTIVQEKETGTLMYTQSMKKGKQAQVLYKFGAIALQITPLVSIFSIIIFFIYQGLFGFVNIQSPVQSLSFLSTCPYAFSIGEFLIVSLLIRILAYLAFVALFSSMAYYFRSLPGFLMGFIVLLLLFQGCSFLAMKFQTLESFNYLNFGLYLHPEKMISRYEFVNLGFLYFPAYYALLWLPSSIVLCMLVSLRLLPKAKMKGWSLFKGREHQPHSLVMYEVKKLLFQEKGILLFMIVLLGFGFFLKDERDVSTATDYVYNHFVETIGDHVSQEADQKIQKQLQYYEELNDKIKKETDRHKQNYYAQQLSTQEGFEIYQAAYDKRKEAHASRKIVKEDEYRYLYANTVSASLMLSCLLMIILYLVPECYLFEKRSKMDLIQNSTRGKYRVFSLKNQVLNWYCGCLLMVMMIMLLIRNRLFYPNMDFGVNIQCLDAYFTFPLAMPLWLYMFMIMAIQLFVLRLLIYVGSLFAKRIQNAYILMAVSFILFILPIWYAPSFAILYKLLYPHSLMHSIILVCFVVVLIILGNMGITEQFHKIKKQWERE